MSLKVILPYVKFLTISGVITSFTVSINLPISPTPSSLFTKLCAEKLSKSSKCSPVPIKIIGESVAETAEIAPPPLACPSNLVIITEPTSTLFLKA